jgi:heat shock protein HslJ
VSLRWLAALLGWGLAACATPSGTAGPADSVPIAGTRWVGVVEGDPDPRTLPRLEFAEGGRVSGYSGCNMMSSSYVEEKGAVRFGPVMATKRFCAGPEGDVEKRVMSALGPGSRAVREGGKLVLTTPAGARFEFVPAEAS